MRFNSFTFIVFFICVYSLYRLLDNKTKPQNILLLVSSYIFYGWWDTRFLFLIVLSTFIDYCCSYIIGYGKRLRKQLIRLSAMVVLCIPLMLGINWNVFQKNEGLNTAAFFPIAKSGVTIVSSLIILMILVTIFFIISGMDEEKKRRRYALAISVISNLTILGFFKYFNFFSDSFGDFWLLITGKSVDLITMNIILPVGISFYTFQTMSYTIDVYRNELKATTSLLNLAVYIAFFPQLVAGPIERGKHLLPQFERKRSIGGADIKTGLWLIIWGFYKKIVIADNMAIIVNSVFSPYDNAAFIAGIPKDGFNVALAIVAFAFQIYGDFSGYTDIARGTARLMGFDIMLNFNIPYISRSPSEFWNRWHISLSSWLRDYLYIPLGGNRNGKVKTYRNLFLTMALGGLWHGAAWNFIIWGVFHGTILIIYRLVAPNISRKGHREFPIWLLFVQWFIMWNLTCLGWLIFRARNLRTIGYFIASIFTNFRISSEGMANLNTMISLTWFLIIFQAVQYKTGNTEPLTKQPWFLKFNVYLLLFCSILFLFPRISQEFIYFAF